MTDTTNSEASPPSSPVIVELQADDLASLLHAGSPPTLVKFGASWCSPCRQLAPQIDAFAQQQTNWRVVSVDIDLNPRSMLRHRIRNIPCCVLFVNGEERSRHVGPMSLHDLKAWAHDALASEPIHPRDAHPATPSA